MMMMRIVLTGASGQLGAYLIDRLVARRHEVIAWSGSTRGERHGLPLHPVDLTAEEEVTSALEDADPEIVIHAAAISSAEAVRRDPQRGRCVNIAATQHLAGWAARHDRRFLLASTDLVFDGSKSWYREEEPAEPVLEYGRTKRAAEPFVLAVPRGVVARLGLLYGPTRCGKPSFFDRSLALLQQGVPQPFFEDEFRTPLHYLTAAEAFVRLAESTYSGLIHVGGPERLSRFELMQRVALALRIDPCLVQPDSRNRSPLPEVRPADVSLDTTRFARLFPDLDRLAVEPAMAAASC
jgi:dTDP-4-dehydrorhamnose reductase